MAYKLYKRGASPYWFVDFGTHDGKRTRQSAGTEDRKQAEEFAKYRQAEFWRAEKLGEQPCVTWDHAVIAWVAEKSDESRGIGLEYDKQRIRALSNVLRGREINSITPAQVKQAVNSLLPNAANSTKNRYMTNGIAILNFAYTNEWRTSMARSQRFVEPPADIRWGTAEEMSRLLAELPEHIAAPAEFTLAVGPREANVRLLEWANIDLDRRHAWINGRSAKGKKSIAVPLNAPAMAVLERQRGKHWKWVFPYRNKSMYDLNCTSWRSALKRAGVANFCWHDLRHTWASWHVQNGTSLYELMHLGGWSKMEMVMVYAHLSTEIVGTASANIDKLWHKSGAPGTPPTTHNIAENRMNTGAGNEARTRDPNLGKVIARTSLKSDYPLNIIKLEDINLSRQITKKAKNIENVPRDVKNPAQKRRTK